MIIEANAHAHQLLIFDARPAVNAKVNKVSSGGITFQITVAIITNILQLP